MKKLTTLGVCLALGLSACSLGTEEVVVIAIPQAAAPVSQLPDSFFAATAPSGALDISALQSAPAAGEDVLVQGRVAYFTADQAVFTLVDLSLESCKQLMEGACAEPWDYCCIPEVTLERATITIEFHEGAAIAATTAEGFHGLDHLDTVIVSGKLTRGAGGQLTVAASALYIAPREPNDS